MKVALKGYYGMGNMGDEAILSVIIKRLRRANPNIEIFVFSKDPEETKRLHNVKAWKDPSLKNPIELIRATLNLSKVDRLIIGGGGILYGKSLGLYCGLALLAKLLGKKVEFYAVGVAPDIHSKILAINVKPTRPKNLLSRFLVPIVMNRVDSISVRDSFSKEVLKKAGVRREIKIVSDPALDLEPIDPEKAKQLLMEAGIRKDDYFLVGLSLRRIPEQQILQKIKEIIPQIIDWLIENYSAKVVFIPFGKNKIMKFDDDRDFALELKKNVKNKDNFIILELLKPEEIKGVIGQMDFLIGMRLHSIVFASSFKIPLIGLIYDVKAKSFLEEIGQPGIEVDNLELNRLKSLIKNLLEA